MDAGTWDGALRRKSTMSAVRNVSGLTESGPSVFR